MGDSWRRKTVMQVLAEAYKAKQQAKAAELKRAQQKEQRTAKAAEERRRSQKRVAAKAEAEHARLLAAGEKHLEREQAAQAREVARVERELAKRQAERQRAAEQREREQARSEKEQQKQARETRLAQLKYEAEQRTLQAQEQGEEPRFLSRPLSQHRRNGRLSPSPPCRPSSSNPVRFPYRQEVTAAGGHAEHVSQGSNQFLRQELRVLRAGALVTEGFRGLLQQFCRRFELLRFDVVGQAGQVAVPVVGAQVAGLAL